MRSDPAAFRLSFLLPSDWRLSYAGPQPAAAGCSLDIAGNLVAIEGRSREACFAAAAWLSRRLHDFTGEPLDLAAVLQGPGGADPWSIAVGADIAFAPTGLGHEFARARQPGESAA